jgi:Uma2 family endonuclease
VSRNVSTAPLAANPRLIAEVLSSSTERIDQEEKRLAYQNIDTMKEYLLVSQSMRSSIHVYRRAGDDWSLEHLGENDRLELVSIGLTVDIEQISEYVEN